MIEEFKGYHPNDLLVQLAVEDACKAGCRYEARESRGAVIFLTAVSSGPLQQGIGPGLIAQRGAPRAAGRARLPSGDPS